MTRIVCDAAHRVEHGHHELRAGLVTLEIHRCHRHTLARATSVSRPKMVERERQDIVFAMPATTKRRITRAELVEDVLDSPFQKILHTASGNGARSRTTVPVNVDPVVPVSST